MEKWLSEGTIVACFQASGAHSEKKWLGFLYKDAADECNQQINGPKMLLKWAAWSENSNQHTPEKGKAVYLARQPV